jgi:hypothetical protein
MAVTGEGNNVPDQVNKEAPPGSEDAAKYIAWWQDRILSARQYHSDAFTRMMEDSRFVRGIQWDNQSDVTDPRYVVNIAQSEVAASVATLYAKNPTFTAKRKPRMDFAIWDENPKTYEEAQMAVAEAIQKAALMPPTLMQGPDGLPVQVQTPPEIPPDALALINDVNEGKLRRQIHERTARTLELLFDQQLLQQQPSFKREMKQLVRRVETVGVGYMKLGFQRMQELSPEGSLRMGDLTSRLATMEALAAKAENAEGGDYAKDAETLRIMIKTLQESSVVITREGLTVNFPRATALIIDPACTQLQGFLGARWVAEEFSLTACKIQEIYKKDVRSKASAYSRNRIEGAADPWAPNRKKGPNDGRDWDDTFRVWELYNLDTGAVMTICEGFDEYLREPGPPDVMIEQFFPYYPVTFNDVEDETCIFPPSTVRLIRHQQQEINRQKEALRQHRINSKPQYAAVNGSMSDEDRSNMEAAPAFAVIELNALEAGQSVDQLLQQIKKHPIDPNMYNSNETVEDIRRITRRSDARIGGVSKASATADSIAEDSRQGEDRSKADDLDDLLSAFARDAGIVLMMNTSKEQVVKLVGPGAMWPESNPAELLEDLYIDVEAGSSGKPNQALEVATFQRLFPVLVQTPGIRPEWLAKTAIKMADSTIDFTEAYLEGLPSIQAMNAMLQKSVSPQPGTGDPATDPQAQGGEGANKTPRPPGQDQSLTVNQGLNDIQGIPEGENSILM